jgi:hypothetical protein
MRRGHRVVNGLVPRRCGALLCHLGHLDLDTARGNSAVFPEDVIRRHQEFVARRRSLRDSVEYREVTPAEWARQSVSYGLKVKW